MASFPPMEARQWAANLLACRQASKWRRRAKVWMFESIITTPVVEYVKKKNGNKMALWIFNIARKIVTTILIHVGFILYTLTVKQYQENKGQIIVNYLEVIKTWCKVN